MRTNWQLLDIFAGLNPGEEAWDVRQAELDQSSRLAAEGGRVDVMWKWSLKTMSCTMPIQRRYSRSSAALAAASAKMSAMMGRGRHQ